MAVFGLAVAGGLLAAVACAAPVGWSPTLTAPHRHRALASWPANSPAAPRALAAGKSVRVRLDADAASAELPGGTSHFRRFVLAKPVAHALVWVRVLTRRQQGASRYTVLAPKLYLLDADGDIRKGVPVRPLALSIRPFRPTALLGCVRVDHLRSFLLADDPDRLGKYYEFNARPNGASAASDGVYRGSATMNVYLPFASTGELVLRVQSVADGVHC